MKNYEVIKNNNNNEREEKRNGSNLLSEWVKHQK